MKQLQRSLCVTGLLLVGSSTLAATQNNDQISKDKPSSTLNVKVSVEARGAYDFKNYYAEPDFGAATIPMKPDKDNGKRFLFDISSAQLSVKKTLPLSGENIIKLMLQVNLEKEIKLKKAYAEFKGFRIGKVGTNFCDPDGCGLVGGEFVQARWQHKLHPLISYALAIEETPDLVIYPEIEKKEDRDKKDLQPHKNIPAISANVRYEEEKQWHAQLGGLFRFLEYHNRRNSMDFYIPAWGITIDTALHLVPEQTTLKVQGVYGQGIGDYIAELAYLEKEVNTVYTTGNETSARKTLNAWGAGTNVKHKWHSKLCSEATYKFIDTLDRERDKDAYKHGHAASVNLFYHPTEQVKIGVEYLFCARKNISKDWKDAHRIQAVVGFEL